MALKIALVGTGGVARGSYLPYLTTREDVSLSYYDRDASRSADCVTRFGGRATSSVAELLADDPDAVLVLTPETKRYEAALEVLAHHPRRMLFEKPLVAQHGQANVSEDDFHLAKEVVDRATAAGTQTAMLFNYRFFDQTLRARQLVADGGFGRLTQASLMVQYACWSHCIDLLALFGGPVAEITAIAGQTPYQNAVDVAAAFRLVNGASGSILGTNGTQFALPLYTMLFAFEGGILRFHDLDGPLEVFRNGQRYSETHALIGNHSRWDQYTASFAKALAAYLDSVAQDAPAPVPSSAGLAELQFEASLRRSAAQGRPVRVQEEFPLG